MKKNLKGYYEYFLSEKKQNISHYQKGFADQVAEYLFQNVQDRISNRSDAFDYLKKLKLSLKNDQGILKRPNLLKLVLLLNKVLYPSTPEDHIKKIIYRKQDTAVAIQLVSRYQDVKISDNYFSLYNDLENYCIALPEKKVADQIINNIIRNIAKSYFNNIHEVIYHISRDLVDNCPKVYQEVYTKTIANLRSVLSKPEVPDLKNAFLILNDFQKQNSIYLNSSSNLKDSYNFYRSFLDDIIFCFSFLGWYRENYLESYFDSKLFIRHIADYLFEEITSTINLDKNSYKQLITELKPADHLPDFSRVSSVISKFNYNAEDKKYINFMINKLMNLFIIFTSEVLEVKVYVDILGASQN